MIKDRINKSKINGTTGLEITKNTKYSN